MIYRLMSEALPLLVCVATGLLLLPIRNEALPMSVGIASLWLSATPRYLKDSYGMQSQWEVDQYAEKARLKETPRTETIIATTLAGTIPY